MQPSEASITSSIHTLPLDRIREALAAHARATRYPALPFAYGTGAGVALGPFKTIASGAEHWQRFIAGASGADLLAAYHAARLDTDPDRTGQDEAHAMPTPRPESEHNTPRETPLESIPGAMMQLVRDVSGNVRAAPMPVSYLDTTAEAAPLPERTTLDADSASARTPRVWRIWRATDPEPGEAPVFDSLSEAQRAFWFADFKEDRDACRSAWEYIVKWIARTYPGCHAMQTPGATGLALVSHTLPWGKGQPRPYEYPLLDPALSRLLAATSPQQRQEPLVLPRTLMRRYTQYDARVAYLACMRHLPVLLDTCADGPIHDEGEYIPYRAGKYRVAVTVPRGWHHIGLAHRPATNGNTWEWPTTPGEEWECWLDECEVRLLREQGWPFAVRERLLFSDTKTPGNDPLREHVERITAAIEHVDQQERTPAVRALRAALRAIAIHPVGLWHKSSNQQTRHIDSYSELTEADAEATITPDDAGGYTVTTLADLDTWQSHWRRTEWSTTVYARSRVTATRKALTAPRPHVATIDGDAVSFVDYTPTPEWTDTGKVGCYRAKVQLTFPRDRRVPESLGALRTLASEQKGA